MSEEKDEFVKFFQKYGVAHSLYDDPTGIMVGQSIFQFKDGRFTGIFWEELGYTEKRIETIGPEIIDKLVETAVWVPSESGMVYAYTQEVWDQIPVGLRDQIDKDIVSVAEDVFQIVIRAGFNLKRWENQLATEVIYKQMSEEFNKFVKFAEQNKLFGQYTMKEYMRLSVRDRLIDRGLLVM